MVQWSLDAFAASEPVGAIVLAAPPERVGELDALVGRRADGPDVTVLAGGATRAQSVANAMAAVDADLVAIHDAARPLLTPDLIEALIADLDANPEAAGVISAVPVADTLKRAASPTSPAFHPPRGGNAGLVIEGTEDRSQLWAAQTPQVFRTKALRAALEVDPEVRDAATDEAMLVERAGGTVLLHHCEAPNLKVTTPADLRLAELLLAERVGAG
jgi:2-C-methyl-D-erythritol 4-phosphate cytidylyltransferase